MTPGPRVVLCTDSFFPVEGGAERQLRNVLAEMRRRGSEPVTIARSAPGLPDRTQVDGFELRRVGPAGGGRLGLLAYVIRTSRETARVRPHVVVALQAGSSSLAALLLRWSTGTPYVVRLTGGSTAGSELQQRHRNRLVRLVVAAVLRNSSAVVAPAEHLLKDLDLYSAEIAAKARLIPNGVSSSHEGTYGAEPRDGTVTWCGRPDPVKRLGDLVELARLLPDVPFVVIGPDRVPGAPDNLRVVGWVSQPADLIRRSSVFVSTSAYEGSSNACLEALAVGTPVVTYDSTGGRELASAFPGSVHLVPVGDLVGLVSATEEVLAQPVDITVDVPSVKTVTDQWLSLLHAAIGAK